jgi:hypothetical protein
VVQYLKNNQYKKGWWCGSSGRMPAYQIQDPEFNYHYQKKEKMLKNN